MLSGLKKTISVVLLFIFLYNISGYYVTFTVLQSGIKETVQNILKGSDTDNLLLVKISPDDDEKITWNGNDEFSLNGKMYDVAFSKHEGTILYLYCYSDSKEEHLFTSLNSHVKNTIDDPVSGKNSKNTLKNPLPDYFMDFNKTEFSFFVFVLNKEITSRFSLLNFSIDEPSPPPRLA